MKDREGNYWFVLFPTRALARYDVSKGNQIRESLWYKIKNDKSFRTTQSRKAERIGLSTNKKINKNFVFS